MKNIILLLLLTGSYYTAVSQCGVQIAPLGDTIFCAGDSVTLKAQGSGGSVNSDSLDQSQLVYNGGTSARALFGYSYWQSFTAGKSGTLSRIDLGLFNYINGTLLVTVWSGSGIYGPLLDSVAAPIYVPGGNVFVPIAVHAPIVAGQIYTFQIRAGAGMPDPYGVQVEVPGSYAGGQMAFVDPYSGATSYPGFDMVFKTYVNGGVSGSGSLSYLWSNNSTDTIITVYTTGNYSVTVSDNSGCSAASGIAVTVNPIPSDTISADRTSICSGDSAHLCSADNYVSYNWGVGVDANCIAVTQSGAYAVSVIDNNGCAATSDTVLINVMPTPVVSVQPDTSNICSNDSIELCASTGFAYQWNNQEESKCIYTSLAGNYYVTATDDNQCTAQSNHAVVNVLPVPSISISVSGDTILAYNANAYQWYRNGQTIQGANKDVYIVVESGSYTVQITDSNGCMAVSNTLEYTGIPGIPGEKVEVYPNPSSINANLILSVSQDFIGSKLELYDPAGKLVYSDRIRTLQSQIDFRPAQGVYILNVFLETQRFTKKIILL